MNVVFFHVGPLAYRGRLFKQVRALEKMGASCRLIHGDPEGCKGGSPRCSVPTDSIRVMWDKNRILTFLSVLWFNIIAAWRCRPYRPTHVVCVGLEGALSGALYKRFHRSVTFVYDSNELSLEMFDSRIKRCLFRRIQNFVITWADVIMHAERHRLEYFQKTYPNRAKLFLLENLPEYREEHPATRDGPVRFVYLGILSGRRYIEELIDVFSDPRLAGHPLDIIGFGRKHYVDLLSAKVEASKTGNIRILPGVPHAQIYDTLRGYDVGFAFYRNTDLNHYYCAPNKVYDYLQMHMAVITNRYPGLVDIIEANQVGVCLDTVDVPSIRDAVRRVVEDRPWEHIREDLRKRYSWEHQEAGYLDLFREGKRI